MSGDEARGHDPNGWTTDDPTLDPAGAVWHEGVLDARGIWPEDAAELLDLADEPPTVEDLGDPAYFDRLRERANHC